MTTTKTIQDTIRRDVADADAILRRVYAEYQIDFDAVRAPPLTIFEHAGRAEAMVRIADPPPVPADAEMIQAVIEFDRCGRRAVAALAMVKVRERYDEFTAAGLLPPDERTWREFADKHFPFGADRANELLGRLVHQGGLLRCTNCGTEARCACPCGVPYAPTHRWALPAAEPRQEPEPATALDRAAAAVAAHPERSNRAIAAEIGVGEPTVRRARRKLQNAAGDDAPDDAPDRVGLDGKHYRPRSGGPEQGR